MTASDIILAAAIMLFLGWALYSYMVLGRP